MHQRRLRRGFLLPAASAAGGSEAQGARVPGFRVLTEPDGEGKRLGGFMPTKLMGWSNNQVITKRMEGLMEKWRQANPSASPPRSCLRPSRGPRA